MDILRNHLNKLSIQEKSIKEMSKYLLSYSSQSEFGKSIDQCFSFMIQIVRSLRVKLDELYGEEDKIERKKKKILAFFYLLNHTLLLSSSIQKRIL